MRQLFGILCVLGYFGAALLPAYPATAEPPIFPGVIELPAGFRPEGIEIGSLPVAYLGSLADGSIYRADLVTGRGAILSPGPGTPAVGLRLDARGRLFVAGGTNGDARVIDTRTGEVLARYQFGTAPGTFVNDVTITPSGAWFTDSRAPVLYHVPIAPDGALPTPDDTVRIPLTGDIDYVPNTFNANGITRTPDGTGLIVVQSVTGRLFRVDCETGLTRAIDLGAETVPDGDGLLLQGTTLFVVQNRLDTIAVIALDPTGTTGVVEKRITDAALDVPTTVATFAGRLYLPNARYDTAPEPTTPYSIVRVD
ncbi:SMP-30/gluconolactonase/LRE family protein [Nocardia sp. NPDC056100]|uniref:SMP-30/gluconolactonase/LRE family protein n=1 Tax=Nocardia sp. NPDC056100 TaxID=3345712 RepID=UPI0035D8F051